MKTTPKPIIIILILFALVSLFIIFYQFLPSAEQNVGQCNYESETKNYIGKSPEECSRIQYFCAQGFQQFKDECGCGCEEIQYQAQIKNYCKEERQGDVCVQLYDPVCGFFDPEKIACKKEPCAETFSNNCFACLDENVLYWTEGECLN